MATMNKPASNDTNWYQAVTDNWVSIENLLDRNVVAAKGDLVAATAASSAASLAVGPDGQITAADSTQATGLNWSEWTPQDIIDLAWGKKFFSDEGFLPSTKLFEYMGTPPSFAGTAGAPTWTREPGVIKVSATGGIAWYDLGAAKSRILLVVGAVLQVSNLSPATIHLTPNAPTGVDPDGYSTRSDSNSIGIYKHTGGAYTRLDTSTGFPSKEYRCGFALYYDDASDTLKVFVRFGSQWFLAQSATDATFTTLRYVAFQSGNSDQRWTTPLVCYAQ